MDSNKLKAWLQWRDGRGMSLAKRYQLATDALDIQKLIEQHPEKASTDSYQAEIAFLKASSTLAITCTDERYPQRLRQIADPPSFLSALGNINLLHGPMIAIVGARRASAWGLDFAHKIAKDLARSGVTVVSGMASGIDKQAHLGALEYERSIAVIATGMDLIYPKTNTSLQKELASKGLILSEFALKSAPARHRFPQRNRIISGLSLGVVVVQAAQKSGSLITARLAAEQGREVFSVPGYVNDPLSRGCHRLLKEGAKLVECANDVLEELGVDQTNLETSVKSKMSDDERFVFSLIQSQPCSMENLIQRSSWSHARISTSVIRLELDGMIVYHPAQGYTRRT